MGTVAEIAIDALAPFVGHMAADTCVRATAISSGKTADDLDASDLPRLSDSIRKLLGPIATSQTIDGIIDEIHQGVGA